jgi:hypothetical protein
MFTRTIASTLGATSDTSLGTVSPSLLGGFVFQTVGCTANFTLTPQIRVAEGGGTWVNCQYKNLATQAVVTAGTAITADGIYTFIADACEGNLHGIYTSGGGAIVVNAWPLEGAGA